MLEDVVKTRLQTQDITTAIIHSDPSRNPSEQSNLLQSTTPRRLSTLEITQQAYRTEGLQVFFRGLGVCTVRAFFVNAVQWAVYEWMMHVLLPPTSK